jgi:hypothetical protein
MKTHIIWFFVCAAALLVGTQFAKKEIQVVEKPVEVVKTREVIVEKPVEVIKEVPKEVEKIVERRVEVPAKIPELYENALVFMERYRASKLVLGKDTLAGVKAVSVSVKLSDDVKKIVSVSDIRTKFEITLRRVGIPIDEKSFYTLTYTQEGFTRDSSTLKWSFGTTLKEFVFAFREDGLVIQTYAPTWITGSYGTVGISQARAALIADAESAAEEFANDWLAMNPKK